MDIFLVNSDSPHADSLIGKLVENNKDGAIIPLNDGEMELYTSPDFQHLSYGKEINPNIIKMEPGSSYVFVADEHANIDDILKVADRLSVKIAIIRTRRDSYGPT